MLPFYLKSLKRPTGRRLRFVDCISSKLVARALSGDGEYRLRDKGHQLAQIPLTYISPQDKRGHAFRIVLLDSSPILE